MKSFVSFFILFLLYISSVNSEQNIAFIDMDRIILTSNPGKIYNQNRNKMISEFNKLKVDNTNKLLKLINPIIVEFASNKKISIILQKKNIVMGATDQDITDEIIKIINSKIEKFKIK